MKCLDLDIIKQLDLKTVCTNPIKAKFIRNTGYLNASNNSSEMKQCVVDLTLLDTIK